MNAVIRSAVGVVLIAGSVAAFATVGLSVASRERAEQEDPTEVRAGDTGNRQLILLLDVTDSYPTDQIQGLTDWIRHQEKLELAAGDVVSVWALGYLPQGELVPIIRKRFPGRVADGLTHNPAMVAAKCDSLFSRPLVRAVVAAASSGGAPRTQIREAIRELSELGTFEGTHVRLVLVSDLGETAPSKLSAHVNLKGASVEVLEIARPRSTFGERERRRALWTDYFTRSGARVRFTRLP
jgi:hypothetical protein